MISIQKIPIVNTISLTYVFEHMKFRHKQYKLYGADSLNDYLKNGAMGFIKNITKRYPL